ncbi:hypothetical protein ACFL6I_17085 [candidate division KSB1 bacterium]
MKKILYSVLVFVLLLAAAVCVSADASDARQDWLDAKEVTKEKKAAHQEARLEFQADNTPENREKVVDTGKEFQHSILDEAEAWLDWKETEAEENERIPDDLRDRIIDDIATNKEKINDLRAEVDAVTNQAQLGAVSLKMIGKYFELLTDVSRNTGLAWVHVANTHADKLEEFEGKLRDAAGDNEEAIEKLDAAMEDIEDARENIDKAEDAYESIEIGKQPFLKQREGNMYLRDARQNMLAAHANLRLAFRLIVRGE